MTIHDLKEKLSIPKSLYQSYITLCLNRNRIALLALAILGIAAELINLARVLFLSTSGLSTLNNRIYFSFYCFLLSACVIYLILQEIWKAHKKALYRLQFTVIFITLLWNTLLSVYDTFRAQAIAPLTVIMFLLGVAALFLLKPIYSVSILIGNFFLYAVLSIPYGSPGEFLNVGIATILACIVSVSQYANLVTELKQRASLKNIQSELEEERERFRLSQDQYALLVNRTGDILFKWDLKEDLIDFSGAWSEFFGYPTHIEHFTSWLAGLQPLDEKKRKRIYKWMAQVRDGTRYVEDEIRVRGLLGTERWYQLRVLTQFSSNGFPRYGIGMLSDNTSQKRVIVQLEKDLKKDLLTGLMNKTAIEAYAEKQLSSQLGNRPVLLLIFDLDNFKTINDTFGHPCGDYALTEFARCLQETFPPQAKIGRIGGDEFVVYWEGAQEELVRQRILELRSCISKLCWKNKPIQLDCSVGISTVTEETKNYAQLYDEADDALYQAKRRGKSSFYFYEAAGKPLNG